MKPLTFTRKLPVTKPIDLSILRPDALVGKEIKEIDRLRLGNDRQSLAVGDIFKISGNNSSADRRSKTPLVHSRKLATE